MQGDDPNDPIDEPINRADADNRFIFIGKTMKTGYIRRVRRTPNGPLPEHDGKFGALTHDDCYDFALQFAQTNVSLPAACKEFGITNRTGKAIVACCIDNRRGIEPPGPDRRKGPGPPMTRDITPAVMHSRPRSGMRRHLRATPKRELPRRNGEVVLQPEKAWEFARDYVARPDMSLNELAYEWKLSQSCAYGIVRALVDTGRGLPDPRHRPALDLNDPEVQKEVIERYSTGAYTIRELADELSLREFDVWRLVQPLGLPGRLALARQAILGEEVQVAALEAARQTHRVIDRATPYQAAIVTGVMVDKLRVIAGEPDMRIRHEHQLPSDPDARREALAKRVEQTDSILSRVQSGHAKLKLRDYEATARVYTAPSTSPSKRPKRAKVG
jgi:hypothetical protein